VRETGRLLELRHRMKAPVQMELPSVVAAAKVGPGDAVSFADERAAVRADVREAVQPILAIPDEDEGLVDEPLEPEKRVDLARDLHRIEIADQLPAPREDALAQCAVDLLVQ
jgi:hypothetical protein